MILPFAPGARVQAMVRKKEKGYAWHEATFSRVTPKGKYMVNVVLDDGTKKMMIVAISHVRAA